MAEKEKENSADEIEESSAKSTPPKETKREKKKKAEQLMAAAPPKAVAVSTEGAIMSRNDIVGDLVCRSATHKQLIVDGRWEQIASRSRITGIKKSSIGKLPKGVIFIPQKG